MIEVEKKFLLSEDDIKRLITGAEFVSETTFTDIYFDTADLSLFSQDVWLRKRDSVFELKIQLKKIARVKHFNQYEEITDESRILEELGLGKGNLEQQIKRINYLPVVKITTTRKKYRKEGFTIDLDIMDFGYRVGEIELLVTKESEVKEAVKRIIKFAEKHDLKIAKVRGKILEYLFRKNNKLYHKLIKAWDLNTKS
jgi:adenylate cyclase class IV